VTAENTPTPAGPDTIVLIHGLWVTPRSWEKWIERYEGRGYRVLAPAYPGFEVEVEALNQDPSPIEAVTIPEVVEHLEGIVGELGEPPITWATQREASLPRSCSITVTGQQGWP
jgi:pimeloyl-ACP methyl ester carboxylesterase